MELASAFMKTTNQIIDADQEIIEIDNEEDIRANIVNISSDNDSDYKLLSLTMTAKVLIPYHLFRDAYILF